MEKAFKLYFHRAEFQEQTDTIDILVCHANVIRYFICRYRPVYVVCYMYHNMHEADVFLHVSQSFAAANCNVGVCNSGKLLCNCHQD